MSPATRLPELVEVFFSYAHEDEDLRNELEKHLSILKRKGVITGWHDRKIGAGKEWEGEIDIHLNTARVILLLVSADFIASDYCWDVEVKRAMERHEAGEARVIPVILRPVDWEGAPFGKLQALPTEAKPVTSWANRDEAFVSVAQGIRASVKELATAEGKDEALKQSTVERPTLFSPAPAVRGFVGRQDELLRVRTVCRRETAKNVVVISGIGGIGKTQLAAKVFEEMQLEWDTLWISCENRMLTLEVFLSEMGRYATHVGFPNLGKQIMNVNAGREVQINGLLNFLAAKQCALFFDGFQHVHDQEFTTFFEKISYYGQNTTVVVTTRVWLDFPSLYNWPQAIEHIQLSGFDKTESFHYLRRLSATFPAFTDLAEEGAEEIWHRTGHGHPIALNLFASLTRYYSLEELLEMLPVYTEELELWVSQLFNELTVDERNLLLGLSVFREPVGRDAAMVVYEGHPPEVVNQLLDRSILIWNGKGFLMHELFREFSYKCLRQKRRTHAKAARYYLDCPADSTSEYVDDQLEAYYHLRQIGDLQRMARVAQRVKRHLFTWGRHGQLTRILQETEPQLIELVREQVGRKRVVVFLGDGDLAWNTIRELQSDETATLAIGKVTIGWAHADFQIVITGEELRDTPRILTLLEGLVPPNIHELPFSPSLLSYYSSFDAEYIFKTASQLGYDVVPNDKAAIMAVDKLSFWTNFKEELDVRPYLLPREPLPLPPQVVSQIRNEVRDPGVNRFLDQTLTRIRAIGLPCVIAPAITELAYGQCIIFEDSVQSLWDALRFAINETDSRKTNPGHRFILEKAVEKPFIEVTQSVVRYRDNANRVRTTCLAPILAERKNRSDIEANELHRLALGPFIFYSAFQTPREDDWPKEVRQQKELMQQVSTKLVDLSGAKEGVYGVGFLLKDDQIWIGDHFVVKPEDKMLVTRVTHTLNTFKLLANVIEGVPMSKADILHMENIGGARTILWHGNEEAELQAIEGVEIANKVPYVTSVEVYSEKRQMWPLRIMGLILAKAQLDVDLGEIRRALNAAEAHIDLIPRRR